MGKSGRTMTRSKKRKGTGSTVRRPIRTVIWAENDPDQYLYVTDKLRTLNVKVLCTDNGRATIDKFEELHSNVDLVLLDVMMPKGELTKRIKSLLEESLGIHYEDMSELRTGHRVGQWIRYRSSQVPILGISSVRDPEVVDWFRENGAGYVQKPCANREIYREIVKALGLQNTLETNCFIVHGHDESTLAELSIFLKKEFSFDRVIVLRDEPEHGRTTIEKFEAVASACDVAFILLTPDDPGQRARQNVVFEAGYFLAKLGRTQGRCVVLTNGEIELPTDLAGMLPIDISNGVESKAPQIRNEIKDWL